MPIYPTLIIARNPVGANTQVRPYNADGKSKQTG